MTRWEWIDLLLSADGPERPTVRFVVWTLIAHYYNDGKGCAWPSVETLAARTAYSVRTVQGALEDSVVAGWLRRTDRPGATAEYRPVLLGEVLRFTPAKSAGVTPAESAPLPRKNCGGAPQNLRPTPAESAPEERRKEGETERRKVGSPVCPKCGSSMLTKPASKRAPAFWGCTRFLGKGKGGCDGTLELDDPRVGEFGVYVAAAKTGTSSGMAASVTEAAVKAKAKSIERENQGRPRAQAGETWEGHGSSRLVVRVEQERVTWRSCSSSAAEVVTGLVAWRLWEQGAARRESRSEAS